MNVLERLQERVLNKELDGTITNTEQLKLFVCGYLQGVYDQFHEDYFSLGDEDYKKIREWVETYYKKPFYYTFGSYEGRPVSRYLDNGLTLEVNRLCTDGTKNACSFLYSAAWRAARNLGYKKLITYILKSENGSSLKASGWKCVGECGGKRWTGKRRPEVDLYPAQMKLRFEIEK